MLMLYSLGISIFSRWYLFFFFSSRRRHTRYWRDWSSDVCSSDLAGYAHANIAGTRTVRDACRAAGVGRLVHVSSPSVAHAGTALTGVGAGPADPLHARGNYSRSKAVAELEALAADSASLAVLAIRPHLVWGPGDTQLVERIVARARAGRLPVIGSGGALIDTTYVDNAAAALITAVDACGPVHGEALVVSNGEPRPVAEVLGRLCRAAGVPVPRRDRKSVVQGKRVELGGRRIIKKN